jgi:DNA-binding NarL/FixJ family response regulator
VASVCPACSRQSQSQSQSFPQLIPRFSSGTGQFSRPSLVVFHMPKYSPTLPRRSGKGRGNERRLSLLETSRTAVLLDRQALWLEALEGILARIDVHVAGKATAPAHALELIGQSRPDIFLTGLEMPEGEMDGITCIARAREVVPDLRVVVVSSMTGVEHIDRALAAGAAAYVVKTAHPDDLATAVRQAFQPSVYFPAPRVKGASRQEEAHVLRLTPREREILRLVAEGHSNATLAKMLWVTQQTVKFHLSNVYRKLGVSNRTEASRWAQLNGLLPPPDGQPQPTQPQI